MVCFIFPTFLRGVLLILCFQLLLSKRSLLFEETLSVVSTLNLVRFVADLGCIRQSILWKRSGSSLNKEWKKKYVTLSNNGTLSYHSSSSVREHPAQPINTAVKQKI